MTLRYSLPWQVFQRQKVPGLAIPLCRGLERSVKEREPPGKIYQRQVEANWSGLRRTVSSLESDAEFRLHLVNCKQVAALDRLKGMELNVIDLTGCDRIADLTPLKGMPLTSLNLNGCTQVRDLTPLKGMKLTSLILSNCDRCMT